MDKRNLLIKKHWKVGHPKCYTQRKYFCTFLRKLEWMEAVWHAFTLMHTLCEKQLRCIRFCCENVIRISQPDFMKVILCRKWNNLSWHCLLCKLTIWNKLVKNYTWFPREKKQKQNKTTQNQNNKPTQNEKVKWIYNLYRKVVKP